MQNHPTSDDYGRTPWDPPSFDPWAAVPEPPQVGDEYDGNPIITRAVKSIYVFAPGKEATITREQASAVLTWWQHYSTLAEREVTAILARFPVQVRPQRTVTEAEDVD